MYGFGGVYDALELRFIGDVGCMKRCRQFGPCFPDAIDQGRDYCFNVAGPGLCVVGDAAVQDSGSLRQRVAGTRVFAVGWDGWRLNDKRKLASGGGPCC